MKRVFIDLISDEIITTRGEDCPIPRKDEEVYIRGNRYLAKLYMYDLDNNRVQIYLQKR